jgi:predicted O-linked N-acetylglucosamine transferase (SPINDLY family)
MRFLLLAVLLHVGVIIGKASLRKRLEELVEKRNYQEIVSIKSEYLALVEDDDYPSLNCIYGEAFLHLMRLDDAEREFKLAIRAFPNDTRSLLHLGELFTQQYRLSEGIKYFQLSLAYGQYASIPRIFRNKIWSCSWESFEILSYDVEKFARECLKNQDGNCGVDSSYGFEFTDVSPTVSAKLLSFGAKEVKENLHQRSLSVNTKPKTRLKIGFLSSNFGAHTVATLIRGLFQFLNQSTFDIYCFSLSHEEDLSWWGRNISQTVPHFLFLPLSTENHYQLASELASYQLDIIIELNGHTAGSGLPLLAYRLAPIQISFLGLPKTTGTHYVDYYLSDVYSVPPEHVTYFTERLLLMNQCSIVNDYQQTQSGLLDQTLWNRAEPNSLLSYTDSTLPSDKRDGNHEDLFLFGTFSNSQKLDPNIFHVWMNILQIFPSSKFLFIQYPGHKEYIPNLWANGKSYGIVSEKRFLSLNQIDWFSHLQYKTSVDVMFDTVVKNGHTTGLDSLWAGIPTVTTGSGLNTDSRAGESMARTLDLSYGVRFSLKDYEDIAHSIKKNIRRMKKNKNYLQFLQRVKNEDDIQKNFFKWSPLLLMWRKELLEKRKSSPLFSTTTWTKNFERLMQVTYDVYQLENNLYHFHKKEKKEKKKWEFENTKTKNMKFHIFAVVE